MCQQAAARKMQASYLPMSELAPLDAAMLNGLEKLQLLALDDLQAVAADPVWAEAIFHLINRCRNQGCHLLLASSASPQSLQVALPDLASRLVWGPVFHLDPLGDPELLAFVFDRARQRGLNLPAEVAHYLVKHLPRDIRYLETLIRLLDEEALARKRRVTLPFLKLVMAEHADALEAGST
jgi:DnaA family protein